MVHTIFFQKDFKGCALRWWHTCFASSMTTSTSFDIKNKQQQQFFGHSFSKINSLPTLYNVHNLNSVIYKLALPKLHTNDSFSLHVPSKPLIKSNRASNILKSMSGDSGERFPGTAPYNCKSKPQSKGQSIIFTYVFFIQDFYG